MNAELNEDFPPCAKMFIELLLTYGFIKSGPHRTTGKCIVPTINSKE